MRLPTTRQLLVCLALSGAFGHAGASELRQLTPESAPQTDPQPASMERLDETDLDVTAAAAAHAPRSTNAQSSSGSSNTTQSTPLATGASPCTSQFNVATASGEFSETNVSSSGVSMACRMSLFLLRMRVF